MLPAGGHAHILHVFKVGLCQHDPVTLVLLVTLRQLLLLLPYDSLIACGFLTQPLGLRSHAEQSLVGGIYLCSPPLQLLCEGGVLLFGRFEMA